MTLENVKSYLRVTYSDDDGYLTSLMKVAEDYLRDGITDYERKSESEHCKARIEQLKLIIIQNLYDERYMLGQPLSMNYMVTSMMAQLEYGDLNV